MPIVGFRISHKTPATSRVFLFRAGNQICYTTLMSKGFTLLELLVVIAILGVLVSIVIVAVSSVRVDALNTRIKSDVRQLRALAESAYDASAASYKDWSTSDAVLTEVVTVLEDLDEALGDPAGAPYITVIAESEDKEFCISAPLHASTGGHYCIDNSGVYKTTTAQCPTTAPLVCP